MPSPTHLRAAGLFERYHVTRHFLGLDSGVLLSARYTCADGSILDKERLFPALRKVIGKHPVLAVKLEGEDSKPSFAKLETIELPLVVHFSNNEDLEAAIQTQLSQPFDTVSQVPLWRVEVLTDGTVILAFHHSIGDGLSAVAFHQCLLAALQDAVVGDDSPLVTIPYPLSLLPPIEAVTSLWPSLHKIFTEVFALFAPISWTRGGSAWTANPVPQASSLETHAKIIAFTSAETVAFAATCRSHGATVTSALYVLAAATISRFVPPNSLQYKTLSAFVAISLRSVANAPADTMCDYVSGYHTYPPVDPAFSWAAAARYATELQGQKRAAREEVGMLMFLFGNIAGYFRGQLGRKRDATFEVSNVGRVADAAGAGPWRIGQMAFAQCNVVVGGALKLNAIADPTGALNVTLTWGDDAIERALVETFVTQFQDGFRMLIE
ncbi:alcohol acetyltransferase [Mycena epipterygia]|nr:alcohol acetyltransferase [Mycena epipterygia]